MTKAYSTILPNRAAISVAGPDARDFLQGLVSQDITLLDGQNLIYSALLTPQGKIDFDFFMSEQGDAIILECEAARADLLIQKLKMFKLRKNLSLNLQPIQVVAIWGDTDALKAFSYPTDPRNIALGLRVYNIDLSSLNGVETSDFNFYDRLRISLSVPDGARDMAIGEDTLADLNFEKLNGVSYAKGCYLGQELTSRMHHRALAKKGLYTVAIRGEALPPFTDIVADQNLIGEMRSSNGTMGLALLRHDYLKQAAMAGLMVAERPETAG